MRNSEKDRDFSWEQRQSGTEKPKQMNTQADTEPTASCSIMDWLFKYPEKCWSLKGQHWKPRINPDCLSYQQTHIHTHTETYICSHHWHPPVLSPKTQSAIFLYAPCPPFLERNLLTTLYRSESFTHASWVTEMCAGPHTQGSQMPKATASWHTETSCLSLHSLYLSSCPLWQSACLFHPLYTLPPSLWRRNHLAVTRTECNLHSVFESYCKWIRVISATLLLINKCKVSPSCLCMCSLKFKTIWPTLTKWFI